VSEDLQLQAAKGSTILVKTGIKLKIEAASNCIINVENGGEVDIRIGRNNEINYL
jgi:hypothetical protein